MSSILSVGCPIDWSCFNLVLICLTGSYSHCFALRTAGDSGVYDCGAPMLVFGIWYLV